MKWTTDEFTGKRFGKYEALCRLAVGGMAEIFLGFARQGPFVGRPVVIKRMLNEQREDPNALRMLLDEARLTATLSHANIAQVVDLEADDEDVLLVIEFITGANLEEITDAVAATRELLPLGFILTAIGEAAQGLGHAHAHKTARGEPLPVVHRDVTPRNIMVDFDGNTRVLDFGIARARGSERRTQAGMVRGTTAYMSPEQAIGKDPDTRSDLFSLGTIFHELLTGRRLFYKGNPGQEMAAVYEQEIPAPSTVNRRVPRQLDAVVLRMLERKLDRRYQVAAEIVRDLNTASAGAAWPKEKCAELVRARFSSREREISALVAKIPKASPAPAALEYPEVRTQIYRGGPRPAPLLNDDDGSAARTLVGAEPLQSRANVPTDPVREAVTDPNRQPLKTTPPKPSPGLPPDFLSPDPEDATRLELPRKLLDSRVATVPGGPALAERPTLPVRNVPVANAARPPKKGSPVMLIAAGVGALVLGGVGGAMILKAMQKPAPPPTAPKRAMVKLSLSTDRPAKVFLGDAELGTTPFSAIVQAGEHSLELQEEDGPRRSLSVELTGEAAEERVTVKLDSLPALP